MNAVDLYNTFQPAHLTLIDAWDSTSLIDGYSSFKNEGLQVGQVELKEFGNYFGGNIRPEPMKIIQQGSKNFQRT